jgi:hypothetical protein
VLSSFLSIKDVEAGAQKQYLIVLQARGLGPGRHTELGAHPHGRGAPLSSARAARRLSAVVCGVGLRPWGPRPAGAAAPLSRLQENIANTFVHIYSTMVGTLWKVGRAFGCIFYLCALRDGTVSVWVTCTWRRGLCRPCRTACLVLAGHVIGRLDSSPSKLKGAQAVRAEAHRL